MTAYRSGNRQLRVDSASSSAIFGSEAAGGPEPDVDGTEMTASKQPFAGGFKQLHDPRPDHIPAM
jgi:hypothetical protein